MRRPLADVICTLLLEDPARAVDVSEAMRHTPLTNAQWEEGFATLWPIFLRSDQGRAGTAELGELLEARPRLPLGWRSRRWFRLRGRRSG